MYLPKHYTSKYCFNTTFIVWHVSISINQKKISYKNIKGKYILISGNKVVHTWCLGILEQIFLALFVLSDGGGEGGDIPTPFEDWRRVLTTSNGHVTTAPAVPATLQKKE